MVKQLTSLSFAIINRKGIVTSIGDSLDNLRNQLIEKLTDLKLLETKKFTLAQVLEKVRALEVAGQQVKHMASGSDVKAA